MIIIYVHERFIDDQRNQKKEPEQQFNLILCMAENASYEYNLIFRVGCPTEYFDMNNSYLDFEILGPKDEIIGTPIRFDCSLLPDLICGEMHCFIGRITAMPPIQGIRVNHSSRIHHRSTTKKMSAIFFYEFELIDLKASRENKTIERRLILDYIESKQKLFRGYNQSKFDEDVGVYPEIPIMELSVIEITITSCFIIMLTGVLVIIFEYSNLYLVNPDQDGSLFRSLQDVIFISPIIMLILFADIIIYKYFIKRLATRYEYAINQKHSDFWKYFTKGYLFFILKVIIISSGLIIYFGLQISFILSLYWFSTTILISSLVLGLWSCCNKFNYLNSYFIYHGKHIDVPMESSKISPSYSARYVSNVGNKTVYFSKYQQLDSKPQEDGPKLVNPNRKDSASIKLNKMAKSKRNECKQTLKQ